MTIKKPTGGTLMLAKFKMTTANMKLATKKGILKTGVKIREEGMKITPIGDTGNLINSWFGPVFLAGQKLMAQLGLAANYAAYVHEMVNASFRRPGAEAKFLEKPLKVNNKNLKHNVEKELRRALR